jgi:hypothetical protein
VEELLILFIINMINVFAEKLTIIKLIPAWLKGDWIHLTLDYLFIGLLNDLLNSLLPHLSRSNSTLFNRS